MFGCYVVNGKKCTTGKVELYCRFKLRSLCKNTFSSRLMTITPEVVFPKGLNPFTWGGERTLLKFFGLDI